MLIWQPFDQVCMLELGDMTSCKASAVEVIQPTIAGLQFPTAKCAVQNGPGATLYLTLFGIAASFLSTFWAYGLTRLSRQLRIYADKGPKGTGRRITKAEVRQSHCLVSDPVPVLLVQHVT